MDGRFGNMSDREERQLVADIAAYVGKDAAERDEAAERRHRELLDRVDSIIGAFAAGLRAAAQALDAGRRR